MDSRPLSPHLQIYRWQLTSVLSIVHRMTGIALTGFIIGLIAWLFSLSQGPYSYQLFMEFLNSWPLKMAGLFLILSLSYHFFNGIRHLLDLLRIG